MLFGVILVVVPLVVAKVVWSPLSQEREALLGHGADRQCSLSLVVAATATATSTTYLTYSTLPSSTACFCRPESGRAFETALREATPDSPASFFFARFFRPDSVVPAFFSGPRHVGPAQRSSIRLRLLLCARTLYLALHSRLHAMTC